MKNNTVFFDHFEIHVNNIEQYCEFLVKLFRGGRYKVIDDSGISMFAGNDGINIEVKKKNIKDAPAQAGLCNPCLRMNNAKSFIEDELKLKITKELKNPDGMVYFFTDHEGVYWHVKDYLFKDRYINW